MTPFDKRHQRESIAAVRKQVRGDLGLVFEARRRPQKGRAMAMALCSRAPRHKTRASLHQNTCHASHSRCRSASRICGGGRWPSISLGEGMPVTSSSCLHPAAQHTLRQENKDAPRSSHAARRRAPQKWARCNKYCEAVAAGASADLPAMKLFVMGRGLQPHDDTPRIRGRYAPRPSSA